MLTQSPLETDTFTSQVSKKKPSSHENLKVVLCCVYCLIIVESKNELAVIKICSDFPRFIS